MKCSSKAAFASMLSLELWPKSARIVAYKDLAKPSASIQMFGPTLCCARLPIEFGKSWLPGFMQHPGIPLVASRATRNRGLSCH